MNPFYLEVSFETFKHLEPKLKFRKKGYEHSKLYQKRVWDGYTSLCYKNGGKYYIPYAFSYLTFDPPRYNLLHEDPFWSGHELRPEQREAVLNLLEGDRGIIEHPTGTGKMTTISYLCARLCSVKPVKNKILVLCYYKKSAKDTLEEIKKSTSCYAGFADKPGNFDVSVATHAWYTKNFIKVSYDILIVDECEMFGKELYTAYKKFYGKAVFGLSATPFRTLGDTLLVNSVFGKVVSKVTYKEAVSKGYIQDVLAVGIEIDRITDTNDTEVSLSEYPPHHRERISVWQNKFRNTIISTVSNNFSSKGYSVLTLVNTKEHVTHLFYSGLNAETYLQGQSSNVVDYLQNKNILALVSTRANRSINIPSLNVVIDTSKSFNANLIQQRLGRLVRKGDKKAFFFFFIDKFHKGKNKTRFFKLLGIQTITIDSYNLEEWLNETI